MCDPNSGKYNCPDLWKLQSHAVTEAPQEHQSRGGLLSAKVPKGSWILVQPAGSQKGYRKSKP